MVNNCEIDTRTPKHDEACCYSRLQLFRDGGDTMAVSAADRPNGQLLRLLRLDSAMLTSENAAVMGQASVHRAITTATSSNCRHTTPMFWEACDTSFLIAMHPHMHSATETGTAMDPTRCAGEQRSTLPLAPTPEKPNPERKSRTSVWRCHRGLQWIRKVALGIGSYENDTTYHTDVRIR